ncbi:MAG: hypothetical protein HGA45_44035, partial [Chloroflexales bacterium]|nr:hypothetical protein [Chloroflexales bacterium]
MAQLLVRNLEDDVKRRLKARAQQHGRSTEEEVREIIDRSIRDLRSEKRAAYLRRSRLTALELDAHVARDRGDVRRAVGRRAE